METTRFASIYDEQGELIHGTGLTKTCEGWKGNLDSYLQIGDLVDDEMYDYFLEVLPPAYWSSRILQIGEPVSHGEWGATYATLRRTANGWMYAGNCYRGQDNAALVR
jgi:hypothetical protein